MRILLSIPCLYGAEHTDEAIRSVVSEKDVDLFLIDNGAEDGVKKVLNKYEEHENVTVLRHPTNTFVNPAWQNAIDWFLSHPEYSHLIIMNSDLIMQPNWSKIIFNRLEQNPDEIIIPNIGDDKNFSKVDINDISVAEARKVDSGTAGVFIVMNRKQAEIVSPLPFDCCKVWFGDEFMYSIWRALGYETVIPQNLHSYHLWSANVSIVKGISEIIEEDKRQWELVGKPRMNDIIDSRKNLKF
jgi:hypothetical protein